MNAVRILATVVAVACIALVAFLLFDLQTPAFVAKLVASSAFIAVAMQSGAVSSGYGRLILVGLICSWFGDMFLTSSSQTAFLAGLCAFLIGHLAYVSAFVKHGYSRGWVLTTAVPVTAIAITVFVWLEPHTPSALLIPVQAYIAVISLMVIFAFGTRGRGGSALIIIGATLFFLSDLSVAALRLVEVEFPTYIWGLPFYYGGQVCLALSVSQSRSH